ncbi:MAG: NUDIX domain-containing protein [Hyphomonadaceae bacterium]
MGDAGVRVPEVGCGAYITNSDGAVLLIKRLREPEAGAWGLPGGKVDFGESAELAVIREISEELGIQISLTGLAGMTETIDGGDGRHWVAPVYHAQIVSGEPRLMEPEKHGGWGWFVPLDMPPNLTTPTRQVLATLGL